MRSKRLNILYAAGLYDGEGSFFMQRKSGGKYAYPVMDVTSTDRDVLEEFARITGTGRIYGPYNTIHKDGSIRKDVFHWKAHGQAAVEVALRLRPYVNGRRGAKIDEVLSLPRGRQ